MNGNLLRNHWKGVSIAVLLLWAYAPTLAELYRKWMKDPQYSHGILVPLFSLYLLLRNRPQDAAPAKPAPVLGFGLLVAALAARVVAARLYFTPLDGLSLILSLFGVVLLTGGMPLFRRSWSAIAFLVFMIPLPYEAERMMGAELQRLATNVTTFTLQVLGQPALMEGNTILLDDVRLNVVGACSGLRMLVTFITFAVGAVLLMERTWLEKGLVLASAIPIALLTNVIRITATGLAHVWLHDSASKGNVLNFIHDFNGWMMMPVGLLFLLLELWLFRHLFIPPEPVAVR